MTSVSQTDVINQYVNKLLTDTGPVDLRAAPSIVYEMAIQHQLQMVHTTATLWLLTAALSYVHYVMLQRMNDGTQNCTYMYRRTCAAVHFVRVTFFVFAFGALMGTIANCTNWTLTPRLQLLEMLQPFIEGTK